MLYEVLKALHIVSVIAWMAGLLYLPRLFVYHIRAAAGSEMDETFKTMEAKLLQIIMNPAMVVVWILGLTLIWIDSRGLGLLAFLGLPWMGVKLAGVLFQTGWHHYLAINRKRFACGERPRSERFWRAVNELPFLVAIPMVMAVTMKFGG
jgi:protoporphyrinogen IX oxidase